MDFSSILTYFSAEGIWAILSVFLIFYIIKDQDKRDERQDQREEKYQDIIAGLTASLKDVAEIKDMLKQKLKN